MAKVYQKSKPATIFNIEGKNNIDLKKYVCAVWDVLRLIQHCYEMLYTLCQVRRLGRSGNLCCYEYSIDFKNYTIISLILSSRPDTLFEYL